MNKNIYIILLFTVMSCQSQEKQNKAINEEQTKKMNESKNIEKAIFAGGCFWCTEAVFLEIEGVETVKPGYIGGKTENPTYKEICTGATGHAEAIEITYDTNKVSYGELLVVFFATHDPTTLNRQGNDIGTQYRSEVFYLTENQKELTEAYIALMTKELTFSKPIVTKISKATTFYVAEDYHHNYYNQNKQQGYCSYVITPKIEKVQYLFASKLKSKQKN